MSTADELKAKIAAMERRNALLAKTAEALRENARLQREATARDRAERTGKMPSARAVYGKQNSGK